MFRCCIEAPHDQLQEASSQAEIQNLIVTPKLVLGTHLHPHGKESRPNYLAKPCLTHRVHLLLLPHVSTQQGSLQAAMGVTPMHLKPAYHASHYQPTIPQLALVHHRPTNGSLELSLL